MQYNIHINQVKCLEWGMKPQQAILFSFLYECPSWCNKIYKDEKEFCIISKNKIAKELPMVTDKPDTVYRLMKQLHDIGLITLSSKDNLTIFRLTDKASEWRFTNSPSETEVGKISDQGRKNIRSRVGKISDLGSEKYPTNHITNNPNTNNHITNNHISLVSNVPIETNARGKKPDFIREIWNQYPEHRRGGTDQQLWKKWKAMRLTESDAVDILKYLAVANESWRLEPRFVPGITKFIDEHRWKVSIDSSNTSNRIDHQDTSWAEGFDPTDEDFIL